ncbi:MAG: M14 family zinc carboxypeptidase, partial [Clostridia bacterium]
MENRIYLKNYIFSFNKLCNYLNTLILSTHSNTRLKHECVIGYSTFNYPINAYKIGHGNNHVIIIGATHGCELVSVYFIIDFILSLILDDTLYEDICDKYTFHFIPVLNPEGYIICSSNVLANTCNLSDILFENLCKQYLEKYNFDDNISKENIKRAKLFPYVLNSSLNFIPNTLMQKNVEKILNNCNLATNFLAVFSANANGVDINSNSIHRFRDIYKLRMKQKFACLRYNDIPVTKPSPMSFPGHNTFKDCPENLALYNYIINKYNYNNGNIDKLIAIFSYHSTGGEIFGFPDKNYSTSHQIAIHNSAMNIYANTTKYTLIDEKIKYGVMDFYRIALQNVVTLTIELSKFNANP